MHRFFDTEVDEHWVLPNVYCNKKNVLTAVAWMHSIAARSLKNNNGMHKRFRESVPPFYDDDKSKPFHGWGVYCRLAVLGHDKKNVDR